MRSALRTAFIAVAVLAVLPLAFAGEGQGRQAAARPKEPPKAPAAQKAKEPDHIRVQHILIGFQGSARPTHATRSQEEAKKLAYEILDRAKKGEDFDSLVKQYTDDRPPGIYAMANNGVTPNTSGGREFARGRMVPAFGDVGFKLAVGEIGMADYDPAKCPYGYHIIKRLQ